MIIKNNLKYKPALGSNRTILVLKWYHHMDEAPEPNCSNRTILVLKLYEFSKGQWDKLCSNRTILVLK